MAVAGDRGRRTARALRLPLLSVMALAAVEYLCMSIFEASPLRTYLYMPLYNVTQSTLKSGGKSSSSWLARLNGKPENGLVEVNKTEIALSSIEYKFPQVEVGGRYRPPNCTAKHKVAIIIPFRDRLTHLTIFLNHMHPFLMKQRLDYGIFVIEQNDRNPFNRAKLFNVGFVESNRLREGGWKCFVFHDVDLLPLHEQNMYSCPLHPRHMSALVDIVNYKYMWPETFGGVTALTYEQFKKVNGFSNKYWGWGGEDDDMYTRVHKMGMGIARYKLSLVNYTMLRHKKQIPNPKRFELLSHTDKEFLKDGLSSLKYKLVEVAKHQLYTLVSVNITEDDTLTEDS